MKKFLFALLFLGTIFYACKSSQQAVEMVNDPENVEIQENLVFNFNQVMVPDSVLNLWDSTPYIDLQPNVKGFFKWVSSTQLVFSPETGFQPATQYKATVTKNVGRFLEEKAFTAAQFSFNTPLLKLLSYHVMWQPVSDNSATILPKLFLQFNYKVDPKDIQSSIKVSSNGNKLNTELITASETNEVELWIKDVTVSDKDIDLVIEFPNNLKPIGGKLGTKDPITERGHLLSALNLHVINLEAEHIGGTGRVMVFMSQPVNIDQIKSFVSITPKVNFHLQSIQNGFEIVSEGFDINTSYDITIRVGAKGNLGGELKNSVTQTIEFGELEPALSFVDETAIYLAKNGNKNIELEITSIEEIDITIYKIYENNIIPVKKTYYNPEYDYEGDYEGGLSYGDIVYQGKIKTSQLPAQNGVRLFHFKFDDKLPNDQGVYYLVVRDASTYWNSASKLISFSDIGLIAKSNKQTIQVFANSISTAMPMAQLNVLVYGKNNQLIGKGFTNADGIADLKLDTRNVKGFEPALVIAKNENDFNYLLFNQTKVSTSRFEVGGKYLNETGLDVYIYGPRDIYRPNETIHYAGIVRTEDWLVPDNNTYIIKWRYPNGKEIMTIRKTTNKEGVFEGSYTLPHSAITGTYTMEVYSPTEVLLATQTYNVEEFVPDRIKLILPNIPKSIKIGSNVDYAVKAMNLFGTPAVNRNYETSTQVKSKTFRPKNFEKYNFNLKNLAVSHEEIFHEGKTNQEGEFTESFEAKQLFENNGVLQVDHFVTVFDETGRPLSRNLQLDVITQHYFIGIGGYEYNYYPLNQNIQFPLIAINYEGGVVSGKAKVEIVKYEYKNILRRSGDYYRYESQKSENIIETKNITIQGDQTRYTYKPTIAGQYAIRVYTDKSNAYIEQTFYSYGSWGAARNSFDVNKEGTVDIEVDKASYKSGETIKALFKTPFDGKLLVTVENNQLVYQKMIEVKNQSASLDIPSSDNFLPNAFITATLIKAHAHSELPLTTAVGYKNVTVEEPNRKLEVNIQSVEQSRSKQTQKITVKAAANSTVSIAVVDEGVLQITDYITPNPYSYFYGKRALAVNSYNLYPFLFHEKYNILSSSGAGDDMMAKRTNSMPANRVEVVSFWSGLKNTGANGTAEFEINIPAFSGNLKVMAVAIKGNQFGASQKDMRVVDPLVISTALPRFMSPNDTVKMPITLTNTTEKSMTANVEVETHKNVKAIAIDQNSVNIPAGKEAVVMYQLIAPNEIGVVNSTVKVKAAGETFDQKIEWSVRPTAPLQKRSGSGSIENGKTQKINFETNNFISSTVDMELLVSALPGVSLGKQLNYLLNYPYGCTEQTISAAFPQLYYKDLVSYYQKAGNVQAAANNVSYALNVIQKRQIYNGGIELWDAGGSVAYEAHWFSSVYAAHFMIEAQRAGYEVDKKTISKLLNYIDGQLRSKKRIDYKYNKGQVKKIAPKEIAYSLYVLALAKQPNRSIMNFYSENKELLSLDGRYLLSVAYALIGDKNGYQQILPKSFSGEVSERATGGSFYSAIRDEAIALNALIDVDPTNNQIPVMAQHVTQAISTARWFSTQEAVFSVLALGKMAKQANANAIAAEVLVDGKSIAQTKGETIKLNTAQLKGKNVEIKTSSGKVYYSWVSEGVDATGSFEAVDNYMKVRRRFLNRNGNEVSNGIFNQNDLIVVELTIEKAYSDNIENVVITDLLPAGFEVENIRISTVPTLNWIKENSYELGRDVRDDRVNLFINLTQQKQTYYYLVRAVSAGTYQLGPVAADAMYNGEMHSYNGGGVIRINP